MSKFLTPQGRALIVCSVIPARTIDFSSKKDLEPEKGLEMVDNFSLYVPINTRNNPNIDIHNIITLRLLCRNEILSRGPIIFGNPEANLGNI